MRALPLAFGLVIFGTFLFAAAPTASAAAYCVQGVKDDWPGDDCDGLVCYGHDQYQWKYCTPPDPICQFQTDCCYYTPNGQAFYCP